MAMAKHRRAAPIGLVVEGKSEYYAIPIFLRKLGIGFTTPAVFHGQSHDMRPASVSARVFPYARTQLKRRISKLLIILDRESRDACAPHLAEEVRSALARNLSDASVSVSCPITVICADRTLENWLLADPAGLSRHAFVKKALRETRPVNVDGSNGKRDLARHFVRGRFYVEGELSGDLANQVRVEEASVQRRSRSLRKFVSEAVTQAGDTR